MVTPFTRSLTIASGLPTIHELACFCDRRKILAVRRNYATSTVLIKNGCNEHDDPCDGESVDSMLHGEFAVNERGHALAFSTRWCRETRSGVESSVRKRAHDSSIIRS